MDRGVSMRELPESLDHDAALQRNHDSTGSLFGKSLGHSGVLYDGDSGDDVRHDLFFVDESIVEMIKCDVFLDQCHRHAIGERMRSSGPAYRQAR